MEKRTRKSLGLALALSLCLSLLPTSALAAGGNVAINEKNFPDPNFRAYMEKEDPNHDKVLTQAEIGTIQEISYPGEKLADNQKIADLTGMEHLFALESLDCSYNKLTRLKLDASRNPKLLQVGCCGNKLTSLDLSRASQVLYLDCCENPLGKLDISKMPQLLVLLCADTGLTRIDTSKNPELVGLLCSDNNLTTLDLRHNPNMLELGCKATKLTRLNLSMLPKLEALDCADNQLSRLDLSHNPALQYVYCENNQLTQLILTSRVLGDLNCSNNQLSQLNFTGAGSLENLYTGGNVRRVADGASVTALYGFDPSRATQITGGNFNGNKVNFAPGSTTISYTYNCGSGRTAAFTLTRKDVGTFKDVTSRDYFFKPVHWAAANEVTAGVGGGLFGPNLSCTRAQIVTFLWNAKGRPAPRSTVSRFSDVPEDSWYYDAVMWAVENDITAGIGGGKFGPDDPCTRSQAMTFLWKFMGKPAATASVSFRDVAEKDWFYTPVRWAVQNHITSGVGGNRFGAEDTCLRAQIVTFMYQALQ